jgi:hypothetical protein
MTMVPPELHVYYVAAAYGVALGGLAALLLYCWANAKRWTGRAEKARAHRAPQK